MGNCNFKAEQEKDSITCKFKHIKLAPKINAIESLALENQSSSFWRNSMTLTSSFDILDAFISNN